MVEQTELNHTSKRSISIHFTVQLSSVGKEVVRRDFMKVNEHDCFSANKQLVNQSCLPELMLNVVGGQDKMIRLL